MSENIPLHAAQRTVLTSVTVNSKLNKDMSKTIDLKIDGGDEDASIEQPEPAIKFEVVRKNEFHYRQENVDLLSPSTDKSFFDDEQEEGSSGNK